MTDSIKNKVITVRLDEKSFKACDDKRQASGHKFQPLLEAFLAWYASTGRLPWLEPENLHVLSGFSDRNSMAEVLQKLHAIEQTVAGIAKALDAEPLSETPQQNDTRTKSDRDITTPKAKAAAVKALRRFDKLPRKIKRRTDGATGGTA